MNFDQKKALLNEIERLHNKKIKAASVTQDYFEPGEMEYLNQYDATWDDDGNICIKFDAKGTRYDGRTEFIERLKVGDKIIVIREADNRYNHNNFTMTDEKGHNVGQMPSELCNVLAPIYDVGELVIISSVVSYVEPITQRSRYAKQAVLFVELKGKILES